MTDVNRFTLKEWVKHPTTILLMVVTGIAYSVIWIYVQSQLEQVEYLKDRVAKLEAQLDKYTNTILFKEATEKQLKEIVQAQRAEIDSLKGGRNEK